jgi:hypothetical protein
MNTSSSGGKPQPTTAAQGGRRRLILPHPIAVLGREHPELELEMLAQLGPDCVFMMGDNPVLAICCKVPGWRCAPDAMKRSCSPACCTTSPMAP